MRKQFYKVEQLDKRVSFNFHRRMLEIKHNTVFIIIYIGRILKSPWTVVDGNGDDPVVLSGRMIDAARIPFVLRTEKTFWIAAGFRVLCRCDGLGKYDERICRPVDERRRRLLVAGG